MCIFIWTNICFTIKVFIQVDMLDVHVHYYSLKTIEGMEIEFSRCILFLSTFLNNVIKRGSFPHCKDWCKIKQALYKFYFILKCLEQWFILWAGVVHEEVMHTKIVSNKLFIFYTSNIIYRYIHINKVASGFMVFSSLELFWSKFVLCLLLLS